MEQVDDTSKRELEEELRHLRSELKQQRKALHETQERYDQLIELLPDAVTVADMDGCIRYVNEAGLVLLGVSRDEDVIGRSLDEFIRADDRMRVWGHLRELRQGKQVDTQEQLVVRPDGQQVPVETASVPIRYRGEDAILTTLRDVTGRKVMEQVLSETQELFYEAFHLGPAALTVSRLSDGLIIDANQQFIDLSGYERDELVDAPAQALNLWDNRFFEQITQDVEAHGAVQDQEAALYCKGGEECTVLISARRIDVRGQSCMLTCLVDISKRKEAEVAERETRSLFATVFENSPVPITISRLSDGQFVNVNDAYCELVGYDEEALVGRSSLDIGLWESPERREELKQRLSEARAVHEFEVEVRSHDGEAHTVLCSFQKIQVKGQPCLLTIHVDITQRKQAEKALRQAKEHAEEMGRFKTSMLRNLTHEVRTPLTVISGFASALREGVRPEYERFVNLIERSGQRLLLMLDAILDLAKLEAGTHDIEPESFNGVDVVRAAAEEWEHVAREKDLSYEIDLPSKQLYVHFDHQILKRVVSNLIDNAIKFTEEGGIVISMHSSDDEVDIIVEDTGVGIDPAYLDDLFSEFSQEDMGLERAHQGSGVGLSVSKRLVELVGGTIEVDSRKGKGSMFTIKLPADPF